MKWKGVRRSREGGEDVALLLALKVEGPCQERSGLSIWKRQENEQM